MQKLANVQKGRNDRQKSLRIPYINSVQQIDKCPLTLE